MILNQIKLPYCLYGKQIVGVFQRATLEENPGYLTRRALFPPRDGPGARFVHPVLTPVILPLQ